MTRMTASLDERQPKILPEKVGDFHCFLVEATAPARTLLHLHHLRMRLGNVIWHWDSMTDTYYERG